MSTTMTVKRLADKAGILKKQHHNWIISKSVKHIPEIQQRETDGYVYVLEYGEYVKIGKTKDIHGRITTLSREARLYGGKTTGRVAYALPHEKFSTNEIKLHKHFAKYRVRGELFNICFDLINWHSLPLDMEFIGDAKRRPSRSTATPINESAPNGGVNQELYSDLLKQIEDATAKMKDITTKIKSQNKETPVKQNSNPPFTALLILTPDELAVLSDEDLANRVLFRSDVIKDAIKEAAQ